MKFKSKPIIILVALIIFGAGFIFGMEYKAYQVRSAISQAFTGSETAEKSPDTSVVEEAKKEAENVVNKNIGDEIVLATGNITAISTEETQTINSKYSSPKVAKEGTKFVVVGLNVVNTTKSEFSFSPDNVFLLQDNQKREFQTYDDSIGSIDNYLNYRTLSPGVKETGSLVYEVPNDAVGYSLVTSKAGTKDVYVIKLK